MWTVKWTKDSQIAMELLALLHGKLDGIALLVADAPCWKSTSRPNPPICSPQVFVAITLGGKKQFSNPYRFGMFLKQGKVGYKMS